VDQDRPLQQVGPGDELLDPVQDHRPLGLERHLLVVGEQLPGREPAPGGQPAEGVRQRGREPRQVVVAQGPAPPGRDHQVPDVLRLGPGVGRPGVGQPLQNPGGGRLRRPLLAEEDQQGERAAGKERLGQPGPDEGERGVVRDVDDPPHVVQAPPGTGPREGPHPLGPDEPDRRDRTLPPPARVDLDHRVVVVGQVDVHPAAGLGHPDVGVAGRPVVDGHPLDRELGGGQGLGVRHLPAGRVPEPGDERGLERLRPDGQGPPAIRRIRPVLGVVPQVERQPEGGQGVGRRRGLLRPGGLGCRRARRRASTARPDSTRTRPRASWNASSRRRSNSARNVGSRRNRWTVSRDSPAAGAAAATDGAARRAARTFCRFAVIGPPGPWQCVRFVCARWRDDRR
jgi:hypothetical protein